MLAKKEIIKTTILILVIGCIAYVGWDILNSYRIRESAKAYQSGADDVTKQIFDQSKENDCKNTVQLKLGSEKLDLIDTKCLGQQTDANPQASVQTEPTVSQKTK